MTYTVKTGFDKMNMDDIMELMAQSHWANKRRRETEERALLNSLCFGVFDENDHQVGMSRVITDYATMFYVSDLIIDRKHQGQGLGTLLMEAILGAPEIHDLWGCLGTTKAEGFYSKFGFEKDKGWFMALPKTHKGDVFSTPERLPD